MGHSLKLSHNRFRPERSFPVRLSMLHCSDPDSVGELPAGDDPDDGAGTVSEADGVGCGCGSCTSALSYFRQCREIFILTRFI